LGSLRGEGRGALSLKVVRAAVLQEHPLGLLPRSSTFMGPSSLDKTLKGGRAVLRHARLLHELGLF
jgi:hypothetical protein